MTPGHCKIRGSFAWRPPSSDCKPLEGRAHFTHFPGLEDALTGAQREGAGQGQPQASPAGDRWRTHPHPGLGEAGPQNLSSQNLRTDL